MTMNDNPTPRIGYPQLKNFIGKHVIFVGQIQTLQGGTVSMQAPDGSVVTVRHNGVQTYDSKFCEVTGVVVDPCTIQEESHVNFGDKFDINLYNEFLKLSNGQHAELFYPPNFTS